jgi:hypothetical protein
MSVREALATVGSVVAFLALRFRFNEKTGELETVRLFGVIPVFDRRRWNARQDRKHGRHPPSTTH